MSAPGPPVVDKPSRVAELIGTTVFLTLFGTFWVGARVYTRIFQTKSFGWDDAFIVLSCVRTERQLGDFL